MSQLWLYNALLRDHLYSKTTFFWPKHGHLIQASLYCHSKPLLFHLGMLILTFWLITDITRFTCGRMSSGSTLLPSSSWFQCMPPRLYSCSTLSVMHLLLCPFRRGCMYVYFGLCMYVCMYICMYVHMYVCMYVCMCVHAYMHAYIYVCMYIRMYLHNYVCMYVHMYVCVYVCMYVYVQCHMC